jgi:diguanylate cyclase (GGDEF)-like protein/PAS domain S-box-containing protein
MENPTLPNYVAAPAITTRAESWREPPASSREAIALSQIWLVANLAALAAVGVAAGDTVPLKLFAGWSAFIVLNCLLHLASRRGAMIGQAAARSSSFDTGIAAMLGLGWGGGVAFVLPAVTDFGLAVLLLSCLSVALISIPVFARHRASFNYFIVTLSGLSIAVIVDDGRFMLAAVWMALTCGCLLIIGTIYYRSQRNLRGIISTLLDNQEDAVVGNEHEQFQEFDLATLADTQVRALKTLRVANRRNRQVLRALGDAVIATDKNGNVEYLNPVAEVLLGWSISELAGRPVEQGMRVALPPDRRNHSRDIFEQTPLTRRAQFSNDNCQLTRRDGVVYGVDYVVTPIKDKHGEFIGAAYVVRDVTEKRHRSETIEWQATHDPLTGTLNRAEFEIRLNTLLRRSLSDTTNSNALLYLDVDNFKFINDTYGHAAGDEALKTLTDVLRTRVRGADTLSRIGGDEFSALLFSCSGEKARVIAESIRIAVERHNFTWQSIALPLSLSIGIVEINRDCKSIAEIMRAADSACYTAKKFGRNRVHLFERGSLGNTKQTRVFDFVKDIQTAIQGNRLEMFYQPLYATSSSDETQQCELSVGVRDAQGDLIPRPQLVELARRYHLTEDIDRWTVKAAIDALRLNHPALSEMKLVLVPLSQQSMADDRMLSHVCRQIRENLAQAPRIGFAFEETNLTRNPDYMRYFVSSLKQYGCQFMIGDLGFGSQPIELLKSMQADYLGVRGSLVQNMLYNSVDYEVVLGLIRIAGALGMKTIAEDAETRPLRDALIKMGIDYTKGQLDDRPRRVTIYSDAQWI